MGIRLGIGSLKIGTKSGGANWANKLYNEADLLAKYITRSGNTLVDSKGGDPVTILTPEIQPTATEYLVGNKTRADELIWDGNNHTIYFRMKLMADIGSGSTYYNICDLGSSGTTRGMRISMRYGHFYLYISDGPVDTSGRIDDIVGAIYAAEYVDVHIVIDAAAKNTIHTVYTPSGVSLGSKTISFSTFTLDATQNASPFTFNGANYIVTNFKKFNAIKTLSQCLDDSYATDLRMHYPNLMAGVDITGNANYLLRAGTFTSANVKYISFNTWALNYGCDVYTNANLASYAASVDVISCRTISGTKNVPSILTATKVMREHDGSLAKHNGIDSIFRFTNAFFDRSNATIWKDAARLGRYDAANVKDFHISELNYRTLYEWLNDDYKGRLYPHFTNGSIEKHHRELSLLLEGVYLYTNNQKSTANKNILTYTKDIKCAVYSGSAVTYDAQDYVKIGYLQATKPMMILRIDDAYQDAYDTWWPYLKTKNVPSILLGIHAGQVGTYVDPYTFMPWNNLQTIYSEGGVIANHNYTDVDYAQAEFQPELENLLRTANTTQEGYGMPCNHYVANRRSGENPSIPYFVNKIGMLSMSTWGTIDDGGNKVNGANPQNIDPFNFCFMAIDLNGPYRVDDAGVDPAPAIQAIKDQIDLCLTNRIAGIFWHGYNIRTKNALDIIIPYCATAGVPIVTMDEALADLKYL